MSCEFGKLSLLVFVAAVQVDPLYFSFVQSEECCINKFTVACMYISSKRLCSINCDSTGFG